MVGANPQILCIRGLRLNLPGSHWKGRAGCIKDSQKIIKNHQMPLLAALMMSQSHDLLCILCCAVVAVVGSSLWFILILLTLSGKSYEKSSDERWLRTVLSSGTLNDRVAANTMLLQVVFSFLLMLKFFFTVRILLHWLGHLNSYHMDNNSFTITFLRSHHFIK